MNRADLLPYVSFSIDDAGAIRTGDPIPGNARIVAWQCGFEPLAVAVWSYLPNTILAADDAEEIASDYLAEMGWFGDEGPRDADYVI